LVLHHFFFLRIFWWQVSITVAFANAAVKQCPIASHARSCLGCLISIDVYRMNLPKDSPVNQFVYELELLQNEFQIEDSIEEATEALLAKGELGKRAPRIYRELGTALSLLLQIASCAWGCRGGEHIEENLIRRLANYSFAALRLARLGLYNESISMLRSVAELANLIELFAVDRDHLNEWYMTAPKDRWKLFRPVEVRRKIEATGNRPVVDKDSYVALCDTGVHVSPESARLSHQPDGKLVGGGEFSRLALLLVLNELAIMLSACLTLSGHFIQAPNDRIQLLTEAGARLGSQASDWLRMTNYQQRLRGEDKDGGSESAT
jgi:hypothetical protein